MPEKPDIILFMTDQHNQFISGCYGDQVVRTPVIDSLAAEGVRFDNTYCPAPLCVPSRMSFMTSRYPSDQRVWTNSCILDSNIPTFAHALSNAGYETVLCGRMHFVGHDQSHGFEKRLVGDITPQFPGTRRTLDNWGGARGQSRLAATLSGPGTTDVQMYDREVASEAARFLKEREGGRPLCMVVGFYAPHCPYVAPKDLFYEYYDKVKKPEIPEGFVENSHPFVSDWLKRRRILEPLSDEEIRAARAAYYGLVTFVDYLMGEVLDQVDRDRTVIVYTSDHGDMAGDHLMWWKSNMYDGSSKVPLVFYRPGRFAEGRSIPQITNLVDIAPTLIEMAGAEPLPMMRGRSLMRFLEPHGPDAADWLDETFSEHYGALRDRPSRMIRSGKWKLNWYHGYERPQLFDMEQDPGEWNDIGENSAYQPVVEHLRERVFEGWDPAGIEETIGRLFTDIEVLKTWGETVRPDTPAYWKAPEGANRLEWEEEN